MRRTVFFTPLLSFIVLCPQGANSQQALIEKILESTRLFEQSEFGILSDVPGVDHISVPQVGSSSAPRSHPSSNGVGDTGYFTLSYCEVGKSRPTYCDHLEDPNTEICKCR